MIFAIAVGGQVWIGPSSANAQAISTALAPSDPTEYFGVAPSGELTDLDVAMMRSSGVGTVRVVLSWPEMQPMAGGEFNWRGPDAKFEKLASHGIRAAPQVTGVPTYAGSPGDPRILEGWTAFVRAAVRRYGAGGPFWSEFRTRYPSLPPVPPTTWQVWNEQNQPTFWPEPSPSAYAGVLHAAATAIRSEDPSAKVMLGGMYGYPKKPRSIAASDFLRQLYAVEGAREDFDIVALHPYSPDMQGIVSQFDAIRGVMAAANDSSAATWVTEIGWSSDPSHPGQWYSQTPEGQADLLSQSWNLLLENRVSWNLKGIIWFTWRDPSVQLCSFCQTSGLIEQDYRPKPSLAAFASRAAAGLPGPVVTSDIVRVADAFGYSGATGQDGTFRMAAGDTLTARNSGPVSAHSVSATDTGPDGHPLFSSDPVLPGNQVQVEGTKYLEPGSYSFICAIDKSMGGTLDVSGSAVVPRPQVSLDVRGLRRGEAKRPELIVRLNAETFSEDISVNARIAGRRTRSLQGLSMDPGEEREVAISLGKTALIARKLNDGRRRKARVSVQATVPWGRPAEARSVLR